MKLAKIITLVIVAGIFVAIFFIFTGGEKVSNQYVVQQIGSNASGRADDETYAEEVTALIKLNQDKTQEISNLSQDFSDFKNEVVKNVSNIEKASAKRIAELEEELVKAKEGLSGSLSKTEGNFQSQLEELRKRNQQSSDPSSQSQANRILGKNDQETKEDPRLKLPTIVPKIPSANIVVPIPEGNVSIKPYGVKAESNSKDDGILNGLGNVFGGLGSVSTPKVTQNSKNPYDLTVSASVDRIVPIPVYTIPDTSTLVINSLMSPLIGRVPDTKNNVNDPFRFKIITGPDNLATNGHTIPGVANIVWTGYSIGVRDQSCVRAYVDTVTFTFEDGRIHTVSSGKNGQGGQGKNTKNNTSLGYLTDVWGKPCIRGEYFSNASDYLKDRTMSALLAGIADATADSQIEMVQNEAGDFKGFMTGNTAQYIGGKALAGTAKELSEYVKERAAGAFDVVYVDSGMSVQLFIEAEIPIDYDPNGRKIAYDYSSEDISHNNEFD